MSPEAQQNGMNITPQQPSNIIEPLTQILTITQNNGLGNIDFKLVDQLYSQGTIEIISLENISKLLGFDISYIANCYDLYHIFLNCFKKGLVKYRGPYMGYDPTGEDIVHDRKTGAIIHEDRVLFKDRRECFAQEGSNSNLDLKNYLLVRTKNFKDRFGDWENHPSQSSKAIDENGEPMIVYHGSNKNFEVFNKDADKNFGWRGNTSYGHYFVSNEQEAQKYTKINSWIFERLLAENRLTDIQRNNIVKLMINKKYSISQNNNFIVGNHILSLNKIKTIFREYYNNSSNTINIGIDDFEKIENKNLGNHKIVGKAIGTFLLPRSKNQSEGKIMAVFLNTRNPVINNDPTLSMDDRYDQAILSQTESSDGCGFQQGNNWYWAVPKSNQIKSATNNSGKFDATNDNINDNINDH